MFNTTTKSSKQIKLDELLPLVTRTDERGDIKYANYYFKEITGYTDLELIGHPHNIIRHPDMPKVIFTLMWQRLKDDQDILTILKNRTKDGNYFWVTTSFRTTYSEVTKHKNGYMAVTHAAPKQAIQEVESLYEKLLEIEKREGEVGSIKYLLDFFEANDTNYDEYLKDITTKHGFLDSMFHKNRVYLK
ncbi:MAG: PAS domain-containing protein [Campylobacterota bacterium]|nr:PAS domain-containing protein [Campylobacterota bacterium]